MSKAKNETKQVKMNDTVSIIKLTLPNAGENIAPWIDVKRDVIVTKGGKNTFDLSDKRRKLGAIGNIVKAPHVQVYEYIVPPGADVDKAITMMKAEAGIKMKAMKEELQASVAFLTDEIKTVKKISINE
jgi:hypothetical protein